MNYEKRLRYLETKWPQYPAVTEKILTAEEFEREFSLLTAGKPSKYSQIILGGRLKALLKSPMNENLERVAFTSGSKEYQLTFENLDEVSNANMQEIFTEGDIVQIRFDWNAVLTSGLFPKVESIKPDKIELLAPAKVKPLDSEFGLKQAKQWQEFLTLIRKFFAFLEFTEVQTPTLVESPGLEPFIDPFEVEWTVGSKRTQLFLPTSPEFSLKKILNCGHNRIFEIKTSFRNGEKSEYHQPEFNMLEWYRAFANLDNIAKDVKGLFNYLKLHWPDQIIGGTVVKETTMAQLFREHCGFELTPHSTREDLAKEAQQLGVSVGSTDTFDDVFFKIFLEKIESRLGFDAPLIVRNYPPSQCAWARITHEGWADRFEVYWKGVELANAFHELNDPIEQRKRFDAANEARIRLGKKKLPVDTDLLESLESGFPPSGGIALGLDRLFMLLISKSDLVQSRYLAKK